MERVSIIEGKLPIIFIAPHGYECDDENTALIAETCAKFINAYAVINRGWERNSSVDYILDKADCNNIVHCHEDVVREEFLEPIFRFKNRILRHSEFVYIYYIHGMSNKHRTITNDPMLDLVVGYGEGNPDSFTCKADHRDLFLSIMHDSGITTYVGSKGGKMSGWSKQNMNQLFRKWYFQPEVQSMQLEIIYELRENKDIALITANQLAEAAKDCLTVKNFKVAPKKYY